MSEPANLNLGERVFRWRSYLPLAAVAMLLWGVAAGRAGSVDLRPWVVAGLVVAAAGLLLRFYAVGHAPPGTSGRHRRQYAEQLNTFGIYSVMRHPLYVGNFLVWAGVSLTTAWPLGIVVSTLVGGAMFWTIVRHEDRYLRERFGGDFAEWAEVTPAFLPQPRLWRRSSQAFAWRKALFSEYSTLHSIGLVSLLIVLLGGLGANQAGARPLASPAWWLALGANTGTYLALRAYRGWWRGRPERKR